MRKLFTILLLLLFTANLYSQDLGVIWQKNDYTTNRSHIANITKQSDGTYLACGWINVDANALYVGYIVHINESGEKLNEYIVSPDASFPQWSQGLATGKNAYFTGAYFTSDGYIMAFGTVRNIGANVADKGHDLGGSGVHGFLKNGMWICKIHKTNKSLAINKLDRGNSSLSSVVKHATDKFLIVGFDYQPSGSDNFMFRIYNADGTWFYDNYTGGHAHKYEWAYVATKLPNNNYRITSAYAVREFDGTNFSFVSETYRTPGVDFTPYLDWNPATKSCIDRTDNTDATGYWLPTGPITVKADGGYWQAGRMSATASNQISYGLYFAEKNSAGQVEQCDVIQGKNTAQSKAYSEAMLLANSTTDYVGTYTDGATNYMYLCKDIIPGGYTITYGAQYPYNTRLSITSHTDGFFSCGQDPATQRAAIAKLSTCANFKTPDSIDIYIPLEPSVNLSKTFRYEGAKGSSASDVQYSLDIVVSKGIVNGQPTGTILESIPFTNVATHSISAGVASGNAFTLNRNYTIGSTHDAELELRLMLKDKYITAGVPQECNQGRTIKVKISKVSSTLFSDDVWFFGQNTGAAEGSAATGVLQTSKAMVFKNESGVMVPYDYSVLNGGKSSMVNSWENSLSVSTPACNGSFIFYTQHNTVFNANHQKMKNGDFAGHTSTGDGLAAAYLGDNKYILAAVSAVNNGNLNYYIIDMNKENGLGELSSATTIETDNTLSESVEMVPVPGTYNQYWLIYYKASDLKVYVRKVDGTNPAAPVISGVVSTLDMTSKLGTITGSNRLFRMKASPDYTKLALNFYIWNAVNGSNIHLLDFNPIDGTLGYDRQIIPTRPSGQNDGYLYADFVFYENYLYIANSDAKTGGGSRLYIHKYNLNDNTQTHINFYGSPGTNWSGGGMKMGPDGKIYLIKQQSNYMAVINDPSAPLSQAGNFVSDGFKLQYGGMGLAISTGLTPPWINPPSSNTPPTTVNDTVSGYVYAPFKINPLLNDSDPDGNALNLSDAGFLTATDAALGAVTWNATTKEVTFTPDISFDLQKDTTIYIYYIAKDNGTPVALCNEGKIAVTIMPAKVQSTLFSDDVWFFGTNKDVTRSGGIWDGISVGTPRTSKAMVFKNNVPYDYALLNGGKSSMVNSLEHTLSVSTPACDGSFIFYASHNQIYNSNHQPMKNGVIKGHWSIAHGLASAYLGDNKYIFFSVSSYGGNNSYLYYYIIDMSAENGLGEVLSENLLNVGYMVNECIELVPVPGTYNKYWLIYHTMHPTTPAGRTIQVRQIDGTTPSSPIIGPVVSSVATGMAHTSVWGMAMSKDYTEIAFLPRSTSVQMYKFNPITGQLAFNYTLPGVLPDAYGISFSPNGKYLYVGQYKGSLDIKQFDLTTKSLVASRPFSYTLPAIYANCYGSGMKIGPDGKMYIVRNESDYLAVIENPDIAFTAPGGGITIDGFKLSTGKNSIIQISTGLTPPWIDPPSSNQAPVALPDSMSGNQYEVMKIKPLLNDTDDGGNGNLNLSDADFLTVTDTAFGNVTWNATNKEVIFTPSLNQNITKDTTIYLYYEVKDIGIPIALCDQGTIKVTIKPTKVTSTLFSDDVWFFGNNETVDQTSKAMVFKNESGVMVPYDYTPINGGKSSMVNSTENSLSVSTPACNGSFIFYTQHNKVFNSLHEEMDGGTFSGNNSNSDGLAACYIGNNKYILFAVSTAEVAGKLNYYYIDMSQNNGLGKMTYGGVIDAAATKVNEAIELIPKVGTYDKYWLIYHDATNVASPVNGKLKVIEIDGSQSNPIGNIVCEIQAPGSKTYYGMYSNTTFDRLAICVRDGGLLPIYKFNPADGQLTHLHTITDRPYVYGAAFSPNSKYIYAVAYPPTITNVNQYDVETGALVATAPYTTTDGGGGMKLGPDGKIYIVRNQHEWMAVIDKPDLALNAPGGGITINGFKLSHKGSGYEPSTGLTPPWINPPSSNTAPVIVNDAVLGTQYDSIRINPLLNDSDDGGQANLNLAAASFITATDANLGDLIWRASTKEVIFVPKLPYLIQKDTTIYIEYVTRDEGAPVSMCESGQIAFTIKYTKVNSTLFSDDVWFFGHNASGSKTSKGIVFENNGGTMVPKDYSNVSMVNSRENSLSVSTPACNGSFIFYTQHNQVFNANHENMVGGSFDGHTSNSDGLAAAYIGDNKYILISVSNQSDAGQLKYYIIDMNLQNGLGQMSNGGVIDNSNKVGEAIELMPKVGTFDEYWLIYYRSDSNIFILYSIKGNNGTPVITKIKEYPSTLIIGSEHIYDIKSNGNFNTIVALKNNQFSLFTFNPLTGDLVHKSTTTSTTTTSPGLYSAEFSPNGKYLYMTNIWTTVGVQPKVIQYDITNLAAPVLVNSIPYSQAATATQGFTGGSIKLGPDGKMYMVRSRVNKMAVIANPDTPLTAASVDMNGFNLSSTGGEDLHISVGLTPPWINPTSTNQQPITTTDSAICVLPSPVTLSPLANDSDPDGHTLFLSGAGFVNDADTIKGTVTWNGTTKTVTFTPKLTYPFVVGEEILLHYVAKDNGIPVSLCEDGLIVITCSFPIKANDDNAFAFTCSTTEIDVVANDITAAGLSLNILQQGAYGSASFVGNKLNYTISGSNCCDKKGYTDTIKYALCINSGMYCDSAIVVVYILGCSDIILENNCGPKPEMTLSHQFQGATYMWQYSADNATWDPPFSQYTGTTCHETKPGYYRAVIDYNGTTYVTDSKQLVLIRKITLPGNVIWYELDLQ